MAGENNHVVLLSHSHSQFISAKGVMEENKHDSWQILSVSFLSHPAGNSGYRLCNYSPVRAAAESR